RVLDDAAGERGTWPFARKHVILVEMFPLQRRIETLELRDRDLQREGAFGGIEQTFRSRIGGGDVFQWRIAHEGDLRTLYAHQCPFLLLWEQEQRMQKDQP